MSAINAYVLSMEEQGIDVMPEYVEPVNPKTDLDCGIWFKSSFGGWYRSKDEAPDITAIRLNGQTYKQGDEGDAAFNEWWNALDSDMQSKDKPF